LKAEQTAINGINNSLKTNKTFGQTIALKTGWTTSTHNSKHILSKHVPFTNAHFLMPPVVQVTIEGQHTGLTVSIDGNSHSGCNVHVSKNSAFNNSDKAHSVHITAIGF